MERLLAEMMPQPDMYFWYTLATVLATALISIIWVFINRIVKILDTTTDSVNKLVTLTAVHDKDIQDNRKDIEKLKEKIWNLN